MGTRDKQGVMVVRHAVDSEIRFVRWPAQADLRNHYKREGIPRLLVIEGGAEPPISGDPQEDWVRAPISRLDLEARVAALRSRSSDRMTPVLDPTGTLSYNTRSITVSTTQAGLMELFIARFGEVVSRNELHQRLTAQTATQPTRNSLDLHIMRLRRRLVTVNLVLSTAWGRGYRLQPMAS
jgi:Transcriptional regulatory protein, C terminal